MKHWIGAVSVVTALTWFSTAWGGAIGQPVDPDADYDRMDGTGVSGKTVNVIEWQGNLEIHVYPAGSLKGLALKIDRTNKKRPVMVIGYRFNSDPNTQLVRRAILSIPISDSFKAYRDSTAADYDKILISSNGLATSTTLAEYKLESGPAYLYPEGHPARGQTNDRLPANAHTPSSASGMKNDSRSFKVRPTRSYKNEQKRRDLPGALPSQSEDHDGTIRPFGM